MNANVPAGPGAADQATQQGEGDPAPAMAPSVVPSTAPVGYSALAALCAIARIHQVAADPATLAHQMGLAPSDPISTNDLLRAAKLIGLKAKLSRTTPDRLPQTTLPTSYQTSLSSVIAANWQ